MRRASVSSCTWALPRSHLAVDRTRLVTPKKDYTAESAGASNPRPKSAAAAEGVRHLFVSNYQRAPLTSAENCNGRHADDIHISGWDSTSRVNQCTLSPSFKLWTLRSENRMRAKKKLRHDGSEVAILIFALPGRGKKRLQAGPEREVRRSPGMTTPAGQLGFRMF